MVIDTSALLAILFAEPEAGSFAAALAADSIRLLSAVSCLEAAMVVETRKGPQGGMDLDLLLSQAGVNVVPFDLPQVEVARSAHARFGKGRHPAGLNFGDCCAYALAVTESQPLLFKGHDFARTDVMAVDLGTP